MNPHSESEPRPELELSESQFIQREFAEFLGGPESDNAGIRWELMYWIRDRLFVDGWTPEQVRTGCSIKPRERAGGRWSTQA